MAGDDLAQVGDALGFLADGEVALQLLVAQLLRPGGVGVAVAEGAVGEVDLDDRVADVFGEQGERGAVARVLVGVADLHADEGVLGLAVGLDAEGLLIFLGEGELGFDAFAQAVWGAREPL